MLLIAVCGLSACVSTKTVEQAPPEPAVMRWDFRPEGRVWTTETLKALQGHGAGLPAMVPSDYAEWCPGYAQQTPENRALFWTGLLSALAKHESTWRPDAVGGGGAWYGLTQIAPGTARGHGCRATSGNALKDGAANLSCAVRIAAKQVTRRGSVSRGMRDWGPFHNSAKRAEMAAWTRAQPFCAVPAAEPASPLAAFLAGGDDA
ncbi:transglycosylase SLT domain-containing protein [Palleronia sediminis]|nr:transglycosylase SLT domain-containing protein [Palleronia sediminis]